jgi:hypothetical protein
MDNAKVKAQVIIEFGLAFVILVVFLLATTRVFVWLGNGIVNRHKAYELSRSAIGGPPLVDFYNATTGKKPLDIFKGKNILLKNEKK